MDFSAAFEGPAVDAGRMSAKQLGPSLFATAELVERSAGVLFSQAGVVTVQIQADFKRGSFELQLIAAVIGQQLLQNLSISDLDLLLRTIGLRGRDPRSLLGFLLGWGDRPIERIDPDPQDESQSLVTVNGDNAQVTVISVTADAARLLRDPAVRAPIADMLAPLQQKGIESFRTGTRSEPDLRITKDDLGKMRPPASMELAEELTDSVSETAIEVLSPNFVEGNKWRVAQGGEPFWVRILDKEFLAQVNSGERGFYKGDFLIVRLRTRAFATPNGLDVEREVLEVLGSKHRASQDGLFGV